MTDERAKRFPLALADLVREPRKPGARAKPRGRALTRALRSMRASSRAAELRRSAAAGEASRAQRRR